MHLESEQMATLILKALAGQLTPEEEAQLTSFKDTSVANRELVEKMMTVPLLRQKLQQYSEIDQEDANWQILRGKLVHSNDDQPVPVRFLSQKWVRYAAAAVILIAGVTVFKLLQRDEPPQQTAVIQKRAVAPALQDVVPGGNRATLTLGDGSVIVLDSASNGSLAQQGSTKIIKTNAGALSYKATGSGGEVLYNTISTPRGGQFQIVLPDGSKAWLNSMSSIRFPTIFSTGERKVTISGEAYFEIVTRRNNPFRVEINGREHSEVEVLGTSFNINAYTDEEIIKTTLLEGSVKVSKQEGSAIIGAGEQAQFNSTRPIKVVPDVDLKEVMAWKNGEFRFNGLTAEELLRQVSRWYDVEVVYDVNLPKVTFWGIVPRQENVSKLLEILAATKQLKFNLEDRKIYVKKYK